MSVKMYDITIDMVELTGEVRAPVEGDLYLHGILVWRATEPRSSHRVIVRLKQDKAAPPKVGDLFTDLPPRAVWEEEDPIPQTRYET